MGESQREMCQLLVEGERKNYKHVFNSHDPMKSLVDHTHFHIQRSVSHLIDAKSIMAFAVILQHEVR